MILDPRSVPPSSWREWLVAGLALSTRRTGTFIAFGAACVAGHALLGTIGLGATMVPLAFGAGCLIAECADKGLTLREALRGRSWRAAWRLALYGFGVAAAFWAVGLFVLSGATLTGLYDPAASTPVAVGEGVARRLAEALCAAWFLSASVVLFGTSVVVTFLVPLLALAEAPFAEALRTALIATRRNDFVVLVTSALAASAAIGFLTPFLVVPWVAIVSSVMYVAYRDVFLGRSENAPAPLAAKARTSSVGQGVGRRSLERCSCR